MGFRVDTDSRAAPLILHAVYGRAATPAELHCELLDRLEHLYSRREPIAEVFDLSQSQAPERDVRQYLTAWTAVHEDAIRQWDVAVGVVVTSRAVRLALAAVWMILPPPAQSYRVFRRRDAALAWAAEKLAVAGLAVDMAAVRQLTDPTAQALAG